MFIIVINTKFNFPLIYITYDNNIIIHFHVFRHNTYTTYYITYTYVIIAVLCSIVSSWYLQLITILWELIAWKLCTKYNQLEICFKMHISCILANYNHTIRLHAHIYSYAIYLKLPIGRQIITFLVCYGYIVYYI